MKDWLAKYAVALIAAFFAGLNVYLNLLNWRKQGTDLLPVALNIIVTFLMLALLLISISKFWFAQRQLSERLERSVLTQAVIEKIKQAGKLESLAGRADYLAQYLEE